MKKGFVAFLLICTTIFVYAQKSIHITHGPWLQAVGESSVNILWKTSAPAVSWVEIAPDDGSHFYAQERPKYFASANGLKTESTLQNVRIEGLKPATTYRYRIYSQEILKHESYVIEYGKVAAAAAYMAKLPIFRTADPNAREVNFAMVNDIHQRNDALKTLLNQLNWDKTNFVIFNGDMVNNLRNEEQLFSSFLDTATSLFASQIPFYYARGNHETRGEFASSFPNYFPTSSGKLYYLLRRGPVCFIFLDTGEDKPDSDIEYSGIADFDYYRTQQAQWLKEALKSDEFRSAPYKIAIAHIPPSPDSWHGNKEVYEKFVPLLNENGVQLMLSAHLHRSVKRPPEEGIRFPVLANSNNSILKVSANSQKMRVEMRDMEGKLMDSIEISPSK